jgi:MoaA/NifB/PqqE/SkfB family radical SAM enzyme
MTAAPAPAAPASASTAAEGKPAPIPRVDGTPRSAPFTARVRISTGLDCNARCAFCYYTGELNTQRYSTAEVLRMLVIARRHGIRDIDFSGGEPTICRDLPIWLAEARAMGFRRICAITNGIRTADRAYLERLAAAGLNEVLISIHGASGEEHDGLVGVRGAFAEVLRTVEHAREIGLRLRTNSVVNRRNVRSVPEIAALVAGLRPAAANFICFNDWVDARPLAKDLAVSYSEAAPFLREAIERTVAAIPKVTVRYIPFCFLEGRERHACGLLQNDGDGDEWNDAVKRLVTDLGGPRLRAYFARLDEAWRTRRAEIEAILEPGEIALLDRRGETPFADFPPELSRAAHRIEHHLKRREYVKAACCRGCSRDAICDGLEPGYAEAMGTGELRAIAGPPIRDPLYFRGPYAASW